MARTLVAPALLLAIGECSINTSSLVHERSLTSASVVANWVSGPFGDCSNFCNTHLRSCSVECRSPDDGQLLAESSCSARQRPPSLKRCGCGLEICKSIPMACSEQEARGDEPHEEAPQHEEASPHEEAPLEETGYKVIGCFKRAWGDVNATTCSVGPMADLDYGCLPWTNKSSPCRSGLPFYRNCAATTVGSCAAFCVGKALDVMAIVEGRECRCGASKLNTAIWHGEKPLDFLLFNTSKLEVAPPGPLCPLLVARYPGHFHAGAIAQSKQTGLLDDVAYVDSIVAHRLITPEGEEHSPTEGAAMAERQVLHNDPKPVASEQASDAESDEPQWTRNCWPLDNCGPGRGPWTNRTSVAPEGVADNWEEYVVIEYVWNDGTSNDAVESVDETRKEVFREAVAKWHSSTCIVLVERTEASSAEYIEVGVFDLDNCYVSNLGIGFTLVNLGWCSEAQHLGNMIHEIGHTLGMNHEMKRADAQQEYHGQGPYLEIFWDIVGSSYSDQYQYLPDADTYVGSADDGTNDPHVGYAAYDYGSIMHYGSTGSDNLQRFATIPAGYEAATGQRLALSLGDINQTLDQYQCRRKRDPPVATELALSGLCSTVSYLDGKWLQVGNTQSGAPYYRHEKFNGWLYWDPDCDSSGTCCTGARWILDSSVPSTTAESDLDEDTGCSYYGRVDNSNSTHPPLGSNYWRFVCDSAWTWVTVDIAFTLTTSVTVTETITTTVSATATTTATTVLTATATATTATATTATATTATATTSTATTSTATTTSSTSVTTTATTVTATSTTSTTTTTTETTVTATSTTATSTTTSSTSVTTTATTVTATSTTSTSTTTTETTVTVTMTTSSTTTATATTSSTTTASTTTTSTTTASTTTTTSSTATSTDTTVSSTTSTTASTTSTDTTVSSTTSTSTATTTSATSATVTRTGGDPPAQPWLFDSAHEEESSVLRQMLTGDHDSLASEAGNIKVMAVRLDSSSTGTSVAVEGTEVEVGIPATTLANLGVDEAILTATVFNATSAASMGDGTTGIIAAVSINLYAANGEKLGVNDLTEPIQITLYKGPPGSVGDVLCAYWDGFELLWATEGLEVSADVLEEGTVVCSTRHFTLFAAIRRNYQCSQLKLLSEEALLGLRTGGWQLSTAALCFWVLLLLFALLMAVAALQDGRWRRRPDVWADEDFLVVLSNAPVALRDAADDEQRERGCAAAGWALLCTCVCNCMLDVVTEILLSWCGLFADLGSFLAGLLEGVQLICTCRGGVLAQRIMSRSLDSSARRQAAATLRISRASASFLLEAPEVTKKLVTPTRRKVAPSDAMEALPSSPTSNRSGERRLGQERARQGEGQEQERERVVAWEVPSPSFSSGKSQMREICESVAMCEFERCLMNSVKWLSLPGSVCRLFLWQNPVGRCLVQCTFLASTLRVLLFMVDMLSALMLCTVFFQASDSLSRRLPVSGSNCEKPKDTVERAGRMIAIGCGAFVISALPALVLRSLSTRRIKTIEHRGSKCFFRQLRTWHAQDVLIWLISLAYLGFSTFFIVLFLANVSEADQDAWIVSGAVSIALNVIIVPFCLSLIIPVFATASLSIASAVRGVGKQALLKERHSKIQRKHANLTLPMIHT